MDKKVNNEILVISRQLRQLTQKEVAQSLGISQGTLSKAEHGLQDIDKSVLKDLASLYNVPLDIFYQDLDKTPTSHYYFRKNITSNKVLDSLVANVQIFKMCIEQLLEPIELPEFDLPLYSPSEELNTIEIANRTRYALGIYKGTVPNLTTLLENHGIIIVKFDFGTEKLDGLSTYNYKGRRIIFLNSQKPNDRMRFSLAHELGHIIMHLNGLPAPNQDVEKEANEFAAQFLMPEEEIEPMLYGISMYDLVMLKSKWKVSMKSLLYRAKKLQTISEPYFRKLQIQYSKKGFNSGEPFPLPLEKPTLLEETINLYQEELDYSKEDLMHLLHIGDIEYNNFFNPQRIKFNISAFSKSKR